MGQRKSGGREGREFSGWSDGERYREGGKETHWNGSSGMDVDERGGGCWEANVESKLVDRRQERRKGGSEGHPFRQPSFRRPFSSVQTSDAG